MNNRFIIILILFISVFSFRMEAVAGNAGSKTELLRKLNNTAPGDSTRLEIYFQLTRVVDNNEIELYYVNKLLQEAKLQKNSWYECRAYLSRMILAYNNYNVEEVNKWMDILEPIAKRENYYDFYFLGKRCVIDMLLVTGEYEREEKEAKKMLQQAKELENKTGVIVAYQCLSNVYYMTYQIKKAAKMKEEAYKVASDHDPNLALEIGSSLVRVYETLSDQENELKWMKIQDEQLQKFIKKYPEKEAEYNFWATMNAIAYLNYYSTTGNLKQAAVYIKQLEKGQQQGETFMVSLHLARYNYYYASGLMNEALKEIDGLIEIYQKDQSLKSYVNMIYLKANILNKLGREDEAIAMYERNLALSDSASIVSLNRQVDQIKADYKTDNLLLEKENTYAKIQYMFLILVAAIILILILFVVHYKRVQKELKKSEEEMRKMAEQMEQANEAKEKFLSAISSYIDVPLKMVVNDSLQLAMQEEIDEEARKEISRRLNETSAELMKLISNILDLSKLEAGMMKFKEDDLLIVSFIQGVVAAKQYNGYQIKLILPEPLEEWNVHVDIARLQEVFDWILIPSSASDGLTLEMKVDEQGGYLHFYVSGTLSSITSQQQMQEKTIGNEVTRLLIEHFCGSYKIESTTLSEIVYFTLPIKKEK